jgi:osmotically-inducible protein OsmY
MKNNIKSLGWTLFTSLSLVALTGIVGCAGDRYSRSTGEYIDDKAVDMRVKSALADNPDYKFGDVKVTSYRGTVQLSGFANNPDMKAKAEDIARRVEGVRVVENNISIKQ